MSLDNTKDNTNEKEQGKFRVELSYDAAAIPTIPTYQAEFDKKKEIIKFGSDNLLPQYLLNLAYSNSPTHAQMLKLFITMIGGKGFIGNAEALKFINQISEDNNEDILHLMAMSMAIFEGFALQVIGKKRVVFTPFEKVRCSLPDGYGIVSDLVINPDWSGRYKSTKLPYFNEKQPQKHMLLYSYVPFNSSYYPVVRYLSAVKNILLEDEIWTHKLAWYKNACRPTLIVEFPENATPDERKETVTNFVKSFEGAAKTGKPVFLFRNPAAPEGVKIQTIEVQSDQSFEKDLSTTQDSIRTGHLSTSKTLSGLEGASSIGGGGNEIMTAYSVFNRMVVGSYQERIVKAMKQILRLNNISDDIEILPLNPADQEVRSEADLLLNKLNAVSPLVANKVLENVSDNEVRAMVGLPERELPDQEASTSVDNLNEDITE